MKLKPFLPILISGAVFIVFLLLPASWFTGLVNEKTVEDNRTSLTDQVHSFKISYTNQTSIILYTALVN